VPLPLPDVTRARLPANVSAAVATDLLVFYRTHCHSLLEHALRGAFADYEKLLRNFWQAVPAHFLCLFAYEPVIDLVGAHHLILISFSLSLEYSTIFTWERQVCQMDQTMYRRLDEALLRSPLQPVPLAFAASIRAFARHLELWTYSALELLPLPAATREYLTRRKIEVCASDVLCSGEREEC
jgi:hypothetical protein